MRKSFKPLFLFVGICIFCTSVKVHASDIDDDIALWIDQAELFSSRLQWDSVQVYIDKLRSVSDPAVIERCKALADVYEAHNYKRSDLDKAMVLAQSAKEYFLKTENVYYVMKSDLAIGNILSNSGNQQKSVEVYLESIEYAESYGSLSEKGRSMSMRILYNAGFSLIKYGDLDQAALLMSKSRDMAIQLKDTMVLAHTYNQMGNIELRRNNFRECIAYNEKGLALTNLIQSSSGIYMESALGSAYSELGILDTARMYLERVVEIRRQGANEYSLAVALLNLSEVYRQEKECEVSNELNHEVVSIASKNGHNHLVLDAEVNLCICAVTNQRYGQGYEYYRKSKEKLGIAFQHSLATDVYKCGADAAAGLGNYKEALSLHKLHKVYADSLINEQSEAVIAELEKKYDYSRQEAEILALEGAALKNKWEYRKWIGLIGVGALAIGLIALLIYFNSRKRVVEEERKRVDIERKLLRFQMNPHFIFNAISSIQNFLFDKRDLKIALTYLSKFADLMRQTLENSREVQIPLDKEIYSLRNYLELQQLRYQNKFEYELIVDDTISLENVMVPPLIAQPFVENAIEHGQIYQVKNGKVTIAFRLEDEELKLTVEDNGVGVRQTEIENMAAVKGKKSLATIITKERLEALSKHGKKNFDLVVEQLQNGGTLVTIGLPKMILN